MPNQGGRGLLGQITAMADKVGKVLPAMGEAVLTTLAATGELLTDGNLRRKAGELIVNETANLQKGLEDRTEQVTREAKARIGAGAQRIQALLRNLERQVERQKRARQEAEAAAGALVDIQIGDQVFEDMPPELRSRLWYVLLEAPHLAEALRPISGPGRSHNSSSPLARAKSARSTAPGAAAASSTPAAGTSTGPGDAAAGAAGGGGGEVAQVSSSGCCSVAPPPPAALPVAPNPWGQQPATSSTSSSSSVGGPSSQGDSRTGAAPSSSSSSGAAPAPPQPSPGGPAGAADTALGSTSTGYDRCDTTSSSNGAGAGEWEMVGRSPSGRVSSSGQLDALGRAREVLRRSEGEEEGSGSGAGSACASSADEAGEGMRAAKNRLFTAMTEVPWLPGEGIPNDIDPLGDYQRALALECPVADDIISRDIGRTFPDHPQFRDPAGQAALWRVLHAYATTDPEVGYCQGMGFLAGLLLMYVPEEVAWRLFCRVMGPPPGGCNLRRLYLPGLNPLKAELSRFELLLSSHQPALHAHLLALGLPAVLYASQWIMTTYCCPFPVHFAARLVDVMLQEGHDGVLARVGLVLMEAMAADLLALDDFEALITHVKVAPLSWPLHTYRQVLEAALDSPVSDAELEAAATAVAAELARLGRPSSFRAAALQRTISSGGTVGHRLVSTGQEAGGAAAAEGGEEAAAAAAAGAVAGSSGTTVLLEEGQGVLPPAAGAAHAVVTEGAGGVVQEQPGGAEGGGMHVSSSAAAAAQLDAELLDAGLGLGLLLTGMDLSEEGEAATAGQQLEQQRRHPHQD